MAAILAIPNEEEIKAGRPKLGSPDGVADAADPALSPLQFADRQRGAAPFLDRVQGADSKVVKAIRPLVWFELLADKFSLKEGKMTKQFRKTMLSVMGLTVAAAMLSSIPTQAQAGSSVVTHGYNTNLGIFDFNVAELTFINVNRTANDYLFAYQMFGPFSGAGSGTIPASSVNISGASVNAGNVTFTLNVNTCGLDPASFTTSQGSCGTFNITWAQIPESVGGSTTTSGTTHQFAPGVGTTITNGHTETFNAVVTGTALGYVYTNGAAGQLVYLANATVTHSK